MSAKRDRIAAQLANVNERIRRIDSAILMRTNLKSSVERSGDLAMRRLLEVERIDLKAEFAANANDCRRLDEEP